MTIPYLEKAVEIAREAGALLANYFERRVAVELKGEFDVVTEADRASEKLVVERLLSHFPSHAIVAEEGGGRESSSEYCWYVDPLDGTTNFAHGFPMFNVTLGLARAGEMIAGVVYDPIRQELFAAERGGGAYLNNRRIRVSTIQRLEDSLPYVACGRLDFFWEFHLSPWDMAAGTLLVEEAGGRVSDMNGAPHSVTASEHLLADNGALHGQAVEIFGEIFRGQFRVPMPRISA